MKGTYLLHQGRVLEHPGIEAACNSRWLSLRYLIRCASFIRSYQTLSPTIFASNIEHIMGLVVIMFIQRAMCAGFVACAMTTIASISAIAAPVVLNPNFTANDQAADDAYNGGALFYIQNWSPTNYASNTNSDPKQYDNGKAGGQAVVGFLSGPSTSLSQVVNGFVVGRTYEIAVGANARSSVKTNPTFRILADNNQVYAPTTLTPVDSAGTFNTAFVPIQSDAFIATNTFVTITLANAATSNVNASTLLTNVSVFQVSEPTSLAILGFVLAAFGLARCRRNGREEALHS